MSDCSPHVLFVAPSAYTLGGLAVWLRYLLPGLRARGWNCTLGLVEGQRWHKAENYIDVNPDSQWIRIPCNSGTEFGRMQALKTTIRRCRAKVVVSVNIPDAIVAASQIKPVNRPLTLMACHGIQADSFADMNRLCSVLDGVACTNRLACLLAEKLGVIAQDRIHYAPCGTDGRFETRVNRSGPEELRIAFVGRLEQDQKRVFDLPEILRQTLNRNINARLIVAGSGPDGDALKTAFARESLTNRVTFLGVLPSAEIPNRVLKTCDAFLLTSHWETGPIVVWEAMAAGLPIVSSHYVGSGREQALVHEHNSLLFPPGDSRLAAEHLERLARNRKFANQLAMSAFETFQTRYTIEESVTAWEKAIEQTLHRGITLGTSELRLPGQNRGTRFGQYLAEIMRRLLGRVPPPQDAGDEWPHTLSGDVKSNADFWRQVTQEDFGQGAFNSGCRSESNTGAIRC